MLRVYLMLKEQYIKTEMTYVANFWLLLISGVIMRVLMLGVSFVIYRNVPDIAGWKEAEVYFIIALLSISEGMCSLLFDGIWSLPGMVFDGEFDRILSRPISPLFQVISLGMGLQGFGVLLMGIVTMCLSLYYLGILTWITILLCLFFIVCGTIIRMSIYLIGCCFVFWMESGGHTNIPYTIMSIGEYAQYPIDVYPKAMRFILLFVIPFAFIGYVPATILRGEQVLRNIVLTLVVTVSLFLLARMMFYRGIRRYESVGM